MVVKCQRIYSFQVQGSGPSLGTLVNQCLGRPLDKSDQFSNWEKRPLRDSQLVYAALDAYCLIQVYDVMKSCCEKGNFHFEETCYNLMTNEKAPKKKPRKPVPRKVRVCICVLAAEIIAETSKRFVFNKESCKFCYFRFAIIFPNCFSRGIVRRRRRQKISNSRRPRTSIRWRLHRLKLSVIRCCKV